MKPENKKTGTKKCELCESDFVVNLRRKRDINKRFCSSLCAKKYNGLSNKGRKFSDEINKKKGLPGEKNPFFGKKHTQASKNKISIANKWNSEDFVYCNLSDIEKQVLEGVMMGDGCISESSRISSRLTFGFKFKDTVSDIFAALPSLRFSNPWQSNISKCWHSKSNMYSDLLQFNKRWYKNNKKIVPLDILLTPISCYWWYIGDGYITDKNVYLCTDCFTKKEVKFLINKLKEKGFICNITSKNRIRFFKKDSLNFLKWLEEHNKIHKQYNYKWKI